VSEWQGFGFSPERTKHYFTVYIPGGSKADDEVIVTENFEWYDMPTPRESLSLGESNKDLKVILKRHKWNEIADECRAEFNRRLIRHGVPNGKWPKSGAVTVDRNLGKELVLLCWAVEECDPNEIPNAVKNWLGLSPEERWWLFTMTNAATGQATKGRNRGWRKAVRYALTENPIADSVIRKRNSDFELTLFSDSGSRFR